MVGGYNKMLGDPEKAEQGEASVDALIENYRKTYGTTEGFEEALRKDPFRFLSDASMFMGGTGTAARAAGASNVGKAVQKAGMAVDPLMATKNVGKAAASKLIPQGLPQSLYEGAAKFSPTIPAADRAAMVQTALD